MRLETSFTLEELDYIRKNAVAIESSDFGPCRCGQLRQLLCANPNRTNYLVYSHGELLFKRWPRYEEPDTQTMNSFLKEHGCGQD